MVNTIQTGIKQHTMKEMTDYALFLGGTNVTNEVLKVYDPLKTGYGRLFMVRKPVWLDSYFAKNTDNNPLTKFKHIIEYGNTAVQGIGDTQVDFESITGGYIGKAFEIPVNVSDNTTSFTVSTYEFSGSPIREVIHTWINGTVDLLTGLTHYNGDDTPVLQANQTAEFIYVSTDSTGKNPEYVCLLANCFPRNINVDPFNYQSGQHAPVQTDIEFSCTKYESIQINAVGKALLNKYQVLTNSLNLYSGFNPAAEDLGGSITGIRYDETTGKLISR